ncbi:hypothetical protein [Pseudoxanthomonas winnipegensis]|uniref:Peptidase S24/S26A/S26B/S26C domain-containing protein n=1 Tax=Pseudoxanthomonas winnipegensis TaxID=2480810 RepID=A0A4Q8L9Y8_9GAMM|nr:hypothetical protein [Pseudoxanthomonas winnipegensis]RZZ81435.1 hypothetical protein EA663_20655 [Pseudoxanthomonas winnipegensis]TAA25431.1 hypothetical protein EA660_08200 [Pseudoxanthomonas winnipegensis]
MNIQTHGMLETHPSVLFPLPAGDYAHVLVRDYCNAPKYVPGDVLLVNLGVTKFLADGLYAVEFAGQQLIRYLRAQGGPLQLFCGSTPSIFTAVTPDSCRVLGMIESAAKVRRVG